MAFKKHLQRWRDKRKWRNVDILHERQATKPDYVVYTPQSLDGSTKDTGNEHFLVFPWPEDAPPGDQQLMAVWTQSSAEGQNNQRIVFSRSLDQGHTWTPPKVIAGPVPPKEGNMASWGFPLISKSGRIYAVYSQHTGIHDTFFHTTGLMHAVYSDDAGETWSAPQGVSMARSKWDNPDPTFPSNWIVWQRPMRWSEGKYFTGFTRWVSKAVRHPPPEKSWTAHESVVEFMRFENLDDDPEPRALVVSFFMSDDEALRVGYPGHDAVSVVQEPSIVALPDRRLFCVMRTRRGCPFFSLSVDAGVHWESPRPLRVQDGAEIIPHPLSPCPIYATGGGKFVLFHHGHDGTFNGWGPKDTLYHRRPIVVSRGHFQPDAAQPIWFDPPRFFMDHTGLGLGLSRRHDLAMYASFTPKLDGQNVLWYPDRKFFLLGKIVPSV